jgi:hypothetical protein
MAGTDLIGSHCPDESGRRYSGPVEFAACRQRVLDYLFSRVSVAIGVGSSLADRDAGW